MIIRFARFSDIDELMSHDMHISEQILFNAVESKRVYVIEEADKIIGMLRFNYFWDHIPFMNLLYILDDYHKKGYGRALVTHWEQEMKKLGYNKVMTSTQENEEGKFFYEKLGYSNVGGFTLPFDPKELVLYKEI